MSSFRNLLLAVVLVVVVVSLSACIAAKPATQVTVVNGETWVNDDTIKGEVVSHVQIKIWWDPVPGAKAYTVYLDGKEWDTTTEPAYDTGSVLLPDTDYVFAIKVVWKK